MSPFFVGFFLLSSTYFFVAEQFHGEALFLDPQTGEKVPDKYLGKARRLQIGKLTIEPKDKSIFSRSVSPAEQSSRSVSPVHGEPETSSAASLVAEASSPASSPIEGSPRLESPDHEEPATLSPAVSPVVVAHKESDVMSDINEALEGVNRNSKNTSDKGYENNCQRCCVAYELRRRGEKVVAKPFNREDEDKELVLVVNLFEQIPEQVNQDSH